MRFSHERCSQIWSERKTSPALYWTLPNPATVWTRGIPVGTATTPVVYPRRVSCLATQAMLTHAIRSSKIDTIQLKSNLTYQEQPIKILDQKVRATRRRAIKFYKVQWSNHSEEEATWEQEDYLRAHYPEFLLSH